MKDLKELLKEKKFSFTPDFTGHLQRFDRNGKTLSAWAVGKVHRSAGRDLQCQRFGDFATDESYEWWSEEAVTPEQKLEMQRFVELEKERYLKEKEAHQEEAALRVAEVWESLTREEVTPYSLKKGLFETFGARLGISQDGDEILYVPMRDVNDKLWNVQRIDPKGEKRFFPKARINSCFFAIGNLTDAEVIYVCEGYATGASIYEALRAGEDGASTKSVDTGATESPPDEKKLHHRFAVVCAFNTGNLRSVTTAIKRKYPSARIIIAGDDDAFTTRPSGEKWNPGVEKAMEVAGACGCVAIFPDFSNVPNLDELRPTDFNDMVCLKGLDSAAELLRGALERAAIAVRDGSVNVPRGTFLGVEPCSTENPPVGDGPGPNVETREAMLPGLCILDKGKVKMPPDSVIAGRMVEIYGDTMLKQDNDLFRYVGTHWKLLGTQDIHELKLQIADLCGGMAGYWKLEELFRLFVIGLPHVPEGKNLFAPNPTCANFKDGTLHLVRGHQREQTLEFRPHSKLDYLVNVLPLEYNKELKPNLEFERMLERVFEKDPDAAGKRRAIAQMYGACLMPMFPHLFMLWGPAGSGKSTVMKLAARLVHAENLSRVEPHLFGGFNMESMAGKLVNLDTDITINAPIQDSIVKKIEDRMPFRISRKGIKDIYAPLPAIHIFGGNDIPPTLEGASRAHDRRWTFIGFSKLIIEGNYDKEYDEVCFDAGPDGILKFALDGLCDLIACRGHFFNPESGKQKMKAWQDDHDTVGAFFNTVDAGEIVDNNSILKVDKGGKISRTKLYELFKIWMERDCTEKRVISAAKFYRRLEELHYTQCVVDGSRFFRGLSIGPRSGATI